MSRSILATALLTLIAACQFENEGPPTAPAAAGPVSINGRQLDEREFGVFESTYRVRPATGTYWYDATSGLWGRAGEGSAGFLLAGHDFGPLQPDISRGDTQIFLNGRHLPLSEVMMFANLVGSGIAPGRYWLDGVGNFGYEGYPAPAGNLYSIVASRGGASSGGGGAGSGGDNIWNTRFSAGNYTADNSAGYVSIPGIGPIGSYGM